MVEEKIEIRGISRKELISYLKQIGATATNNLIWEGVNWSCHVGDEGSFRMFQSTIPKVELIFKAESEEILSHILTLFRKKTFRAGG